MLLCGCPDIIARKHTPSFVPLLLLGTIASIKDLSNVQVKQPSVFLSRLGRIAIEILLGMTSDGN